MCSFCFGIYFFLFSFPHWVKKDCFPNFPDFWKPLFASRVSCGSLKWTHSLACANISATGTMKARNLSWPDYKFREKQFWNINVAWIYWGQGSHISPRWPVPAAAVCLSACGPFKIKWSGTLFARLSCVWCCTAASASQRWRHHADWLASVCLHSLSLRHGATACPSGRLAGRSSFVSPAFSAPVCCFCSLRNHLWRSMFTVARRRWLHFVVGPQSKT